MKDRSVGSSHMASSPPTGLERRKKPLQARSTATVDAIFEGTVQVLLSDGPTRLTTTRVAQRTGVSVGTVYQYFPHKQALLFGALARHLAMIVGTLEAACLKYRGASVGTMAEAVVAAYLLAKREQCDVSRALYLVAAELDSRKLIEDTTQRGEQAIAAMLATASDGRFTDPQLVAQTLLAAVAGTVRAFYERDLPPALGGDIATQLTLMCRAYLVGVSGVSSA